MLRQHPKILSFTAQLLDIFTNTIAFFISFLVRHLFIKWVQYGERISIQPFWSLLFLFLFVWYILLYWQKVYGPQRLISFKSLFFKIFNTTVLATLISIVIIYLFKRTELPRTLVLTFSVVSFTFLIIEKFLWFKLLEYLRSKGKGYSNVIIVGATEIAKQFVDSVNHFSDWGVTIVGFLVRETNRNIFSYCNAPILGNCQSLSTVLHQHPVDEVIFALPINEFENMREMMEICELEGVKTRILSNLFSGLVSKAEADIIHGIPIITYSPAPRSAVQILLKRTIDICLSSITLIILAPLFVIIALAIKLTSSGPVFYPWKVMGLNKKPFTGYKFRTMVENADEMKEKLVDKNEMNGPVFKMQDDPRVTKLGKFLRKYSLDELPQFWSVLRGNMSLVGPHPPLQTELRRFDGWHRRKLSVKPGITCLWQINGRANISDFDEWVKMDLEYIDNWSLWLDFKILLKTVPAVLSRRGAY